MAALAALPYAIAEFAKLAGLTSIASLGTAKAIDTIRNYVKANPEKSKQIISTLSPTVGGLANIVLNKDSETEETPSTKDIVLGAKDKEKGNYSSDDAEGNYASKRGRIIKALKDAGKIKENPDPDYDASKKYQGYKRFIKKAEGGIISLANGGMTKQDLQSNAPKGEFLAYINPKEAGILKSLGGSGKPVNGIPSFTEDEEDTGDVSNPGGNSGGGGDQEDDNAAMAAAMAAASAEANAAAEEREIIGLQKNRRNDYGLNRVGFETPYGITDPDLGKAVVDYSTPFGNFNGFLSTLGILGVDNPMTPGVDESQQSKGGINFTSPNMFGIEGLNTKANYTAGGSNPGNNLEINFSKKFKEGGRVNYARGGRATTQDYANALQQVGAGTQTQKSNSINNYAQNEAYEILNNAMSNQSAFTDLYNNYIKGSHVNNNAFSFGRSGMGYVQGGNGLGIFDPKYKQQVLDQITSKLQQNANNNITYKPRKKTYRTYSPEAQALNMDQSTYENIISMGADPKQYYMDFHNRTLEEAGVPQSEFIKYGQIAGGPAMGPGNMSNMMQAQAQAQTQSLQNNPQGFQNFDDAVKYYGSNDPYMSQKQEIKDMVNGVDTGYMSGQDYYDQRVLGLDGQGIAEKYGLQYSTGGRVGYNQGGLVTMFAEKR